MMTEIKLNKSRVFGFVGGIMTTSNCIIVHPRTLDGKITYVKNTYTNKNREQGLMLSST